MSKEKTQELMGKIFTEASRDAIHIAVISVVAKSELSPGTHIGYDNGFATPDKTVGIVDPFLKEPAKKGEMFFLFLYPNTISGLRHVWSHPTIPDHDAPSKLSKEQSEEWLRNFCDTHDTPGYENIIKAVKGEEVEGGYYTLDSDYFHWNDIDAHSDIPSEFWDHIENVTGLKQTTRPSTFSCSC